MSLSQQATSKNYVITEKEITPCGYIGYEIDSGITQMKLSEALPTAVSLMQKRIVHSISVFGEEGTIHFKFQKDHLSINNRNMIYQDYTQTAFIRSVDYKNIRFVITTYRMPEKHKNIITNITEFVSLLDYISYFLLTPLSKPVPSILKNELSLREQIDLINCNELDFQLNYEEQEEDELYLLEDYFELEAALPRKEIMSLAQDISNDSTRIKAMVYLNDEEFEFELVTSEKETNIVEWDWDYALENVRFQLSPFNINKDYFRAIIKLNASDLEMIRTLNCVADVLQFLKK